MSDTDKTAALTQLVLDSLTQSTRELEKQRLRTYHASRDNLHRVLSTIRGLPRPPAGSRQEFLASRAISDAETLAVAAGHSPDDVKEMTSQAQRERTH